MDARDTTDAEELARQEGIARAVAESADRQGKLVSWAQEALAESVGLADFNERMGKIGKVLFDGASAAMGGGEAAGGPKRLGELLEAALGRMVARQRGDEKAVPVPWPDLRTLLGGLGLWPGAHILVAGTGAGKTTLQLQWALEAARAGTPVLYIGLELGEVDVVARLVTALDEARPDKAEGLKGVAYSDMLNGQVAEDRLAGLISAAMHHLSELPFDLEFGDVYGWDYERLVPAIKGLRQRYQCADSDPVFVVLDYLQLVDSPKDSEGRRRREDVRERIGHAAYQAREAGRHHNAAVLVTSSASRTSVKDLAAWGAAWPGVAGAGKDGSVSLQDLVGLGKEAGEIEYSADTVIVLSPTPKIEGEKGTRMRIGLAKNRNGVPGDTTLMFLGPRWIPDMGRKEAEKRHADKKTAGTGDGSTKPPARGGTTATTAPAKTPPGRGKPSPHDQLDAEDREMQREIAKLKGGAP